MRILAVDISNLFRRNWEAAQGKELGEAFNRTVQAVARFRDGFDRVAICCDGGTSFRKAISQQYKANRTDPGEAYRDQLRRTLERLEQDGCTVFKAPPVLDPQGAEGQQLFAEADDTIGALCKWALEDVHEVGILSGDKDLFQLVSEGVWVIRPEGGPIVGPEQVKERLGVPPYLVPDFLALAGDASDGYKPYKGIADTRAVALLLACGSALGVFHPDNLERLDGIVGQANGKTLREAGAEPARRALQLATIRRDLDIDFSPLLAEPEIKPLLQLVDAPAPPAESAAAQAPAQAPTALVLPPKPQQAEIISKADPWNLQPSGARSLMELANHFAEARCFPNVGHPAQVIAVTVIAQNLGVPMGIAMQHAYFVQGRLSWSAAFIVGLVRRQPDCEKLFVADTKPDSATVIYKRRGDPEGRYTFTLEMARKAGWVKDGGQWSKRPDNMCRWAALREVCRMVWPDLVAGLYCRDEMGAADFEEAA